MICAIVWGDDDTFGRFNNSLSMNGTGITQHDVVLPDVEAGVTYQYVVEGTTADGTWYRSDVGTFSVEAVAVATTVDRGPNLATGARIVDVVVGVLRRLRRGQRDRRRHRHRVGDRRRRRSRLDHHRPGFDASASAASPSSPARWPTARRSPTRSRSASTAPIRIGPFPAGTVASPRVADVDVTGEQLRFDVASSSGGNVGAVEIEVFG